jgi:hypothetical protein
LFVTIIFGEFMKTVNWDLIVSTMKSELIDFINHDMSGETFYKIGVSLGIGPECRYLIKLGMGRARKNAREALRRRSIEIPTPVNV